MNTSLDTLHNHFITTINQDKTYLDILEDRIQTVGPKPTNNVRLKHIFQIASTCIKAKIQEGLETSNAHELQNKINRVTKFEEDGKALYNKYCNHTNKLWRKTLKIVDHYSPRFLRNWFPRIFSHPTLAQAEQDTLQEYHNYLNTLNTLKNALEAAKTRIRNNAPVITTTSPENFNPTPAPNVNSDSTLSPQPISTTQPPVQIQNPLEQERLRLEQERLRLEQEKKARLEQEQLRIEQSRLEKISTQVKSSIGMLTTFRGSIDRYKNELGQLIRAIKALPQQKLIELLTPLQFDESVKNLLKDPHALEQAYNTNERALLKALEGTPLEQPAKTAAGHQEMIFNVRRVMSNTFAEGNLGGQRVNQRDMKNFTGILSLASLNLNTFNDFASKNSQFKPVALKITFDKTHYPINADKVRQLIQLHQSGYEITLIGVDELNFSTLGLTPEEQSQFLDILPSLTTPALKNIVLDDTYVSLTVPQCYTYLKYDFSLEKLRYCFRKCNTPFELDLTMLNHWLELDLSNFTYEQQTIILKQNPKALSVILDGSTITSPQLKLLIDSGYLNEVQSLSLKSCPNLDTDTIHHILSLKNLRDIDLPDLQQGSLPLPKFDNPFKARLYLSSVITRRSVQDLYTGPSSYSTFIKILLARAGERSIFTPQDKVIGPISASFWLFKEDFRNLSPQESVESILADNCEYLNDNNVLDFIQKFPKVKRLSFKYCPNLTNAGVQKILNALSDNFKLDTLNLKGCKGITNDLLNVSGNNLKLIKIKRIVLSDTNVTKQKVTSFFGSNLEYKEKTLTLSNQKLADPHFLENFLNGLDLRSLDTLSFEDCTNLTNEALSKVLDRLSLGRDDKQQLNIAHLNLKGCSNISLDAFEKRIINPDGQNKIEQKALVNLAQISFEGTQFRGDLMHSKFKTVEFQPVYRAPTTIFDVKNSLDACRYYHEEGGNPSTVVQNRMIVELFGEGISPKESEIKATPIDTSLESLQGFLVILRPYQTDGSTDIKVRIPKETLYCQSGYFRTRFMPGKESFKAGSMAIEFDNPNATPEALTELAKFLRGEPVTKELDWTLAANVAELSKKSLFNLSPSYYKSLTDLIFNKFKESLGQFYLEQLNQHNIGQIDKFILRVIQLDQKLLSSYEDELIQLVREQPQQAEELSLFGSYRNFNNLVRISDDIVVKKMDELGVEGYE